MLHAPIYGSQVNSPAKLDKRFTPTETIVLIWKKENFEIVHWHWISETDVERMKEK